jgi:hypothetical protein
LWGIKSGPITNAKSVGRDSNSGELEISNLGAGGEQAVQIIRVTPPSLRYSSFAAPQLRALDVSKSA